jgi:adenylate kinase
VIVVLLGPPGCGKGTQGEKLAAALKVPKISTGDVIRAAMKAGTPLGLKAKAQYDAGELVSDDLIMGIIRETLAAPEQARGAVLDGVVRTVPQAEGLQGVLKGLGRTLDLVLMFQISDEELVGRLSGRTVCDACGAIFSGRQPGESHTDCPKSPKGNLGRRKDDEPEAIRTRLRVYHDQTAPVLAWYKANGGPLKEIDARGSVDDVRARVLGAAGVR